MVITFHLPENYYKDPNNPNNYFAHIIDTEYSSYYKKMTASRIKVFLKYTLYDFLKIYTDEERKEHPESILEYILDTIEWGPDNQTSMEEIDEWLNTPPTYDIIIDYKNYTATIVHVKRPKTPSEIIHYDSMSSFFKGYKKIH